MCRVKVQTSAITITKHRGTTNKQIILIHFCFGKKNIYQRLFALKKNLKKNTNHPIFVAKKILSKKKFMKVIESSFKFIRWDS